MDIKKIHLSSLAKMIDHSLLHPTLSDNQLESGCELARKYQVATVCVKPYAVHMAGKFLAGSSVGIGTVAGFPHGNSEIEIKSQEAENAISKGASEIDMVVNIGKVLSSDWKYVSNEIKTINNLIVSKKAVLKVIFETDFLKDEHIIQLCKICTEHRVAFVKTSSGFGFVKQPNGFYAYKGATEHNITLMRKTCPESLQVKAAGGIRSLSSLLHLRELGVTRIGATATEIMLEEAIARGCINDLR